MKCFLCKDPSHVKKDLSKYHTWHVKKGIPLILVYTEVNLISMPRYTLVVGFMSYHSHKYIYARLVELSLTK